jgi:hypothetical protein
MTRRWVTAAGLIAMIAAPALATAQTAGGSLVLTMPHFAFYSDLATNAHDALITAATARRAKRAEPFTAGAEKACFVGLSAADRDGWMRAIDCTRTLTDAARDLVRTLSEPPR